MIDNIHDWVKSEENNYESDEIQVGDNWYWNMREHIQLIFHLLNNKFYTGENNWLRSFKQVMKPIVTLANWTEDIEVKDAVFYSTSKNGKALSFLLKKYHDEVYAQEKELDRLFDEITELDNEYGGVIIQKGEKRPEALPFNSIAFCDQTDIEGGPIAFKFDFSPDKLKKMGRFGWGEERNGADISLDELVTMASFEKDVDGTLAERENDVPGKTIEVYIVRGDMPSHYLNNDDDMDTYTPQLQIIAYYTSKDKKKHGVTLYRKKDTDGLKFFSSKPINGRALGESVAEDMLNPQIWTNFLSIHKMNLIEAGSKVPLYTDDASYRTKNKIQDMETLEITTIEEGKDIKQVPTASSANIQIIQNAIDEWQNHAQFVGAAFDPVLGKEAVSGTTFRGQERTVAQGRGSHDRKRGKRAVFIAELYKDWIIPEMVKEIKSGKKFLATLSVDELTWVADTLTTKGLNDRIKEKLLQGELMSPEEQEQFKTLFKENFQKKGNKQLLEIVDGEFKDVDIEVQVSVANKQKNLADLSDKVLSIFQFIFANPQAFQQAMQIPALSKSFGDILEFSGLSMGDFSTLLNTPQVEAPQQEQPQGQEQELLPKQEKVA